MIVVDSFERRRDITLAMLRITFGVMIAGLHGLHKVSEGYRYFASGEEWPLLLDTMQMGFPAPAAFAASAAIVQFVGGILIAVGALTRPAAVLIGCTLLTALAFNVRTSGPDTQLAGVYALIAGLFIILGGGYWSLDRRRPLRSSVRRFGAS